MFSSYALPISREFMKCAEYGIGTYGYLKIKSRHPGSWQIEQSGFFVCLDCTGKYKSMLPT